MHDIYAAKIRDESGLGMPVEFMLVATFLLWIYYL